MKAFFNGIFAVRSLTGKNILIYLIEYNIFIEFENVINSCTDKKAQTSTHNYYCNFAIVYNTRQRVEEDVCMSHELGNKSKSRRDVRSGKGSNNMFRCFY